MLCAPDHFPWLDRAIGAGNPLSPVDNLYAKLFLQFAAFSIMWYPAGALMLVRMMSTGAIMMSVGYKMLLVTAFGTVCSLTTFCMEYRQMHAGFFAAAVWTAPTAGGVGGNGHGGRGGGGNANNNNIHGRNNIWQRLYWIPLLAVFLALVLSL